MNVFAEAHARFRYIPDADRDADWVTQYTADHFNSPAQTEAAGGGDCDDFAVWACIRGHERGGGSWRVVLGQVKVASQWLGHAWVEIVSPEGARIWADPTWGLNPATPALLGFPDTRKPVKMFAFDGVVFSEPLDPVVA